LAKKFAFHDQLADLGVQPFDPTLMLGRAVAVAGLERSCRLIQE
jgi:hypothetical protein